MQRIDDERDPARGADRLARLVRADQRRPRRRRRRRRSAATPPRRTRTPASATGSSSTPAARTRSTPTSSRSRARSGTGARRRRRSARSRRRCSSDLADNCDGEVANDAGRPAGALADGTWPADPYPDPDPERHAFQIRLTVHEAGDPTTSAATARRSSPTATTATSPAGRGRSAPAPTPADYVTGSGGEVLAAPLRPRRRQRARRDPGDLERRALRARRRRRPAAELQRRPAGARPSRYALAQRHPAPAASPAAPRESLRVPAIGDIDGDLEPEIVVTAGEHVYAWDADGSRVDGFPVRRRPGALGARAWPGAPKPCFDPADRAITERQPHQARVLRLAGARRPRRRRPPRHRRRLARPARLRLGRRRRRRCPASRRSSRRDGADGAEIVTSPAIAELDGDGPPEIVIATNEVDPRRPGAARRTRSTCSTRSSARRPARTRSTRSTATAPRSTAGRSRSASRPATCCRWSCPATTRRSSTRRRRRRRGLGLGGTSLAPGGTRLVDGDGVDGHAPTTSARGQQRPTRARSSTSPTTRRSATSSAPAARR